MRDAWAWRVVYHDGTFLDEYERSVTHGWSDVDMTPGRISHIALVSHRAHLPSHLLALPAGSRPIFFRRRSVSANGAGEQVIGGDPPAITCLGWQRTIAGQNVKSCTFFLETGEVIVTDDVDAVNHGVGGLPSVATAPLPDTTLATPLAD